MTSEDMIWPPMNGKNRVPAGKPEAVARCERIDDQAYNFRFVEVGEPFQGGNENSRSTIRSHVMRDYYEKKDHRRRPSNLPEPSSAASQKVVVLQRTHKFKVGPQGLQEIKIGHRKSKGTSRANRKAANLATNISGPENIPAPTQSSAQAFDFDQPESATFTLSGHWIQRAEGETSDEGRGPAAESIIPIGNALHQPQSEVGNRNISPSNMISPTPGVIDPFHCLPLICAPRTQLLLYHASQAILSSGIMGPLRREWLATATQDQAFFHVALSHYAGNYGLAKAERDPMEAVRFRMEAMKIINERLGVVEIALTDGTLGTVASLASYEATNGNLSDIRTHMKGLERMVVLRGGLQDPSINQFIKRLMLWADLNCAIAMGTNPIFSGLELDHCGPSSPPHATNEEGAETSNENPSGSCTSRVTNVEILSEELKENFINLSKLVKINKTKKSTSSPGKEERSRDSDMLYLTERSLLSISNIWGPRKFITSGCLAALIFTDNQLRGINFRATVIEKVVGRLQVSLSTVLEGISQHDLQEPSNKAIFWSLFVGAIAAAHGPRREWYIERLLGSSDVLDIQTWEDTENILQGFLWTADWQAQGRVIWNEIEENRSMKNTTFPDATPDKNYRISATC